ncbi:hypothetical protein ACFWGI_06305 [Streptomyces niveus]|uniref:hypothetical protein n=1 Tax=Streptomyces niveus TaxID=193462 RepID=UPI003667553B
MQADLARRRMTQALVAVMFAAFVLIAGPGTPKAHAIPNPCNAPGGKYVCDKAMKGAEVVLENSGGSLVEGVTEAADFATDPLGYLEKKLRSGTEEMFSSFGEALTGKKASAPKKDEKGNED